MVRDDLADVALANEVFAPHYVRGLMRVLGDAVDIHVSPRIDSDKIGHLPAGDNVDVFDVSGGWAWVRSSFGPGYISAAALAAL